MWTAVAISLLLPTSAWAQKAPTSVRRPNVVVVMTDDQGFGDFGFAGNPVIRTPNLDALARRSARLTDFYVSPVCTPTRAALMTGRWCQRTRAFDTYIGRAMMEPDEVTVAEVLRGAGYATAIFGKWHLGDCYPMRAIDQGFELSLVLRGGGIGQPSDPVGGEGKYTDPVLFRNGVREEMTGYCTDVYFREALAWMKDCREAGRPFFCYLPTNAPHGPLRDVPQAAYRRYLADGLGPERFPATAGAPAPAKYDEDRLARIYAMIENVDDNMGRLVDGLRALGCLDDTLVLFLNDNGPEGRRWVAGYRGAKSEVYEGGIKSPLWALWPKRLEAGDASDRVAAHVDLMPTILAACGVAVPEGLRLDGRSVLPLLERRAEGWPDRALVIQANRGDAPLRYHNFALRTQRWKLVNASGFGRELTEPPELRAELYDMAADPYELEDVAAAQGEVVAELRKAYDAWFDAAGLAARAGVAGLGCAGGVAGGGAAGGEVRGRGAGAGGAEGGGGDVLVWGGRAGVRGEGGCARGSVRGRAGCGRRCDPSGSRGRGGEVRCASARAAAEVNEREGVVWGVGCGVRRGLALSSEAGRGKT